MAQFSNIFEKILFLGILFILVFIPLYPKFPLVNVPGTFVAVRLEDIFIFGIIGLWGIYLLVSQKIIPLLKSTLFQSILVFLFIGAVSVFSGMFLTHTVQSHLGILHYLRRIEFILLLPLAYTVIKTKKQIIITLGLLLLVLIGVNAYGLGQQYLNWPVVSTGNSEFSKGLILYLTPGARINSTFAGHYDLAVYLSIAVTVLSALFFGVKNKIIKLVIASQLFLTFFILVLTAARISFVATIVGVMMTLVLSKQTKFILLLIILAIAAIAYPSHLRDRFVSTITINFENGGQRYANFTEDQQRRHQLNIPTLSILEATDAAKEFNPSGETASDIVPGEPLDTTELGVSRSLDIRLNYEWPAALRAFYKNPLLGTGYSSLGIATDNDFLRSLGEVGILGTLAFALILIFMFKKLWKLSKTNDRVVKYLCIGFLVAVPTFLVNALFIDVFEASKVASLFWLTCGIALASEHLDEQKETS